MEGRWWIVDADLFRRGARSHRVGKHPKHPRELIEVLPGPVREGLDRHALAGPVDGIGRGLALGRDGRLAHPFVGPAVLARDKLEVFEPGDLAADRRVITPQPSGEIDYADGAEPLDRDKYREQGTVQPQSCGRDHGRIAIRPVQFLTERILRERLAEFERQVEFGCELMAFMQDEDGVTAQIARTDGEETICARYLVGADGGRSYVRDALGIGFPGKTLGVRAMVADVMLDGLSRDVWHQFNEGDMAWQISVCPLAGTDLFQLQAPVPQDGDVDLSVEGLNRMLGERTGRSDVRVFSISWASAYVMNARLADRYQVDRVLLIGDAAHIHPPTGGQGLNTSVQDAYNLG